MMRVSVALAFAGLLFVLTPASASAQEKSLVRGQVIVVPAPGVSIDSINAEYRTTVMDRIVQGDGTALYLLQFPTSSHTAKRLRQMQTDADLVSAAANSRIFSPPAAHRPINFPFDHAVLAKPDDHDPMGYNTQAFLGALRLGDALTISRGTGVVVAVIDTGEDFGSHSELTAQLWHNPNEVVNGIDDDPSDTLGLVDDVNGWDFYANDNDPSEDGVDADAAYGHGTFIAGIITKIAPDARIMPLRAFGPDGVGTAWNICRSIQYAVAHGADVINMSFGSSVELDPIKWALIYAKSHAVLVAAVGNRAG